MAPISKLIPFLFLTTLLLSLQANARDSQFFSKVTPLSNNNNNIKETEVSKTEGPVLNKPEQQPNFIPETENSYGLYGHETGLHPPSTTITNAVPYTTTTTTYQPYKTTTAEEDIAKTKYSNNNNYYNFKKDSYNSNQNELSETRLTDTSYNNNNYFSNNKDAFGKQNELSDTKYTQGYNSMENQNNNNGYYNNNNNGYYYNNNNNDAPNNMHYKTKAVNNNYNGERQGLSDTRFMEGGKYFYNVNSDNWSNHRGYFGNNNVNSYENKNSMEGYQNQEVFEDDQEDFDP
ncbi:hypothetical protein Fmac_030098 [Flemingia macrophylla]|uniref:Protein E6 n=1 Tax=Flemingia macrophylla TaxID=520843 RepID=A0ABD1LC83_9FABA